MSFNSKVFLRKTEDPIFLSEEGAKKLEAVFLDPKASYDQPLKAGKIAFFKSEIKKIEINPDTDDTVDAHHKPHWIIFSPRRNTIFKTPFLSRQEAEREMEFQKINLPEGMEGDWIIKESFQA